MINIFYSFLVIFATHKLITVAEGYVKSSENGQELLLCRKCGTDVADSHYLFNYRSPGARRREKRKLFGKDNVTVQTLVNPFGIRFDVVTTEKARCNNIGHPEGADSWFPGFTWRLCTCPHCGEHLGWTFENASIGISHDPVVITTFHGLILSNILGENYTHLILQQGSFGL